MQNPRSGLNQQTGNSLLQEGWVFYGEGVIPKAFSRARTMLGSGLPFVLVGSLLLRTQSVDSFHPHANDGMIALAVQPDGKVLMGAIFRRKLPVSRRAGAGQRGGNPGLVVSVFGNCQRSHPATRRQGAGGEPVDATSPASTRAAR